MNTMEPSALVAEPETWLHGQATVRNLAYYVEMCKAYERVHEHWPTLNSSRKAFALAGIDNYDGRLVEKALANPCRELARDPAYKRLLSRSICEGASQVSLRTLDPRCTDSLPAPTVAALFDTASLPGTATGAASDAGTRAGAWIALRIPHRLWQKAAQLAGLDASHPDLYARSSNLQVRESPDLKRFIDRLGMPRADSAQPLQRRYFLEVTELNRLYIRDTAADVMRYGANVDMDRLASKLAQVFASDPGLAPFGDDAEKRRLQRIDTERMAARMSDLLATIPVFSASGNDPAPASKADGRRVPADDELRSQLARLTPVGNRLLLPAERLSRTRDVKRLVEQAGGRHRVSKDLFEFDMGVNTADVLSRLLGGDRQHPKKRPHFFPCTPKEAREACVAAGSLSGLRVLDPAAGEGAIADVARRMGADIVTVEWWNVNVQRLRDRGHEPIERDFLELTPDEIGTFDAIVTKLSYGTSRDIDYFMHMCQFLKPGGSLSVVMSTTWMTGPLFKHHEFRQFLRTHDIDITQNESVALDAAGRTVPMARITIRNYGAAPMALPAPKRPRLHH